MDVNKLGAVLPTPRAVLWGYHCLANRNHAISTPMRAAVGGVAATAIGDPAVFVSVDAMHQGPKGGGPVIAIVDMGD